DRLLVELALLVRVSKAEPAPAGLEQRQQAVRVSVAAAARGLLVRELRVIALEHLVHEDPETLRKRLFARDRVHARELVAERADPVDIDVGRREHQALAADRQI